MLSGAKCSDNPRSSQCEPFCDPKARRLAGKLMSGSRVSSESYVRINAALDRPVCVRCDMAVANGVVKGPIRDAHCANFSARNLITNSAPSSPMGLAGRCFGCSA